MKIVKRRNIIILCILLCISFLLLLTELFTDKKDVTTYEISIITRGKSDESWMIMKEGAEQAATEMNANIRFITLSNEDLLEEQKELIQRESKNGADAILISPINSEEIKETIDTLQKNIPIVLIESSIGSKNKISTVTCDNYNLGKKLGEELLKNNKENQKIVIASKDLDHSSSKERYDGLMSILNETNTICTMWNLENNKESDYYKQAERFLKNNTMDVIVTFDTEVLEAIAQAKKDKIADDESVRDIKVYGTGNTSKVISFLEEGIVNGTAIQNEFNIGYIGVKRAIGIINGEGIQIDKIDSTIITNENMYSKENQRILFLFIR